MDSALNSLTIIFTEFYYWVTIPLMFLIHVGFCLYEVGVSRHKNHLHTLIKNTMLIPLVTITFFLFGWWLYFALPNAPIAIDWASAKQARPWDPLMGPHFGAKDDPDGWARINGVFWAAFLLFSWTAASILSGAVIERIRHGAFWFSAILVGSITWVIAAAWGWHPDGWMVRVLGYHDAYASGVVHAVAGGAALGLLVVLGPRLGRFDPQGNITAIPARNPWLVCIGLFLIYTGFWGFYAACNIPIMDFGAPESGSFFSASNIYGAPTTLSAITVNLLMSLTGGMMAGYLVAKGDVFWTYSAGLAGIITASAGNDLYHPIQALLVGAMGAVGAYKIHLWVEKRFQIDDAVGAVAVHGYAGFIGLLCTGFLLWGYPTSMNPSYATITPWGQLIGAIIVFFGLGFLPTFLLGKCLQRIGLLRPPAAIEAIGLDHLEPNYESEDLQQQTKKQEENQLKQALQEASKYVNKSKQPES